jgi:hypothetical protein
VFPVSVFNDSNETKSYKLHPLENIINFGEYYYALAGLITGYIFCFTAKSLAVRYMHHSNGGLNDDNPGLDFLSLTYAREFLPFY